MIIWYEDNVQSQAWYGDINWFVDAFRHNRSETLLTWYGRRTGVSLIEYYCCCYCCCWWRIDIRQPFCFEYCCCRRGDAGRLGDPRWILLLEGETLCGQFTLSIASTGGGDFRQAIRIEYCCWKGISRAGVSLWVLLLLEEERSRTGVSLWVLLRMMLLLACEHFAYWVLLLLEVTRGRFALSIAAAGVRQFAASVTLLLLLPGADLFAALFCRALLAVADFVSWRL